MDPNKDKQTQERAYQIWEDEGRPHGRHDEHWSRAEQEAGSGAASHVGMMGDGTEEQNLDQPGTPGARITEDEVKAAFTSGKAKAKP